MAGKPCPQGCQCRKHYRTKEHNYLIGQGLLLTQEANRRLGRPINQHG